MSEQPSSRRSSRYPVELPVSCKYTPKGAHITRTASGWTRNLSETGACLALTEALTSGTRLGLILQAEEDSLALEAVVVWGDRPSPPGARSLHGVAFHDLTTDQRQALRRLLQRQRQRWPWAQRAQVALPARCHPLGTPDPPLEGWTGDISRVGCSLVLPEQLAEGTVVEVTLIAPRGDVTAKGTVVWSASPVRGATGQLLRHGVRFTDKNLARDMRIGFLLEGASASDPPDSPAS